MKILSRLKSEIESRINLVVTNRLTEVLNIQGNLTKKMSELEKKVGKLLMVPKKEMNIIETPLKIATEKLTKD